MASEDPNVSRRMALAMTNAEQASLWYNAGMEGLDTFDEDDDA